MAFRPSIEEPLAIGDLTYHFAEHPNAPGVPYGQEGRRAVVYQLVGEAGTFKALKVFKQRYRLPSMVTIAEKLAPYAGLPGLQICQRMVLTGSQHPNLLAQYPELTYAVLMPWMEGRTWQEIVVSKESTAPEEALKMAQSLAQVLMIMEERGLAHCDLAGPNLIISPANDTVLVDLEETYGPGFLQPEILPSGSSGYAHKTAQNGLWKSQADRFAGAILLAEMLGWCDERIRQQSWGESYFKPEEVQTKCSRFNSLHRILRDLWGERVVELLDRAWQSDSLADCPTFAEWNVALLSTTPKAVVIEQVQESETVPPVAVVVAEKSGNEGSIDSSSLQSESGLQQNQGPPVAWICPHCHREVTENGVICPYCERSKDEPVGRAIGKSELWKSHFLVRWILANIGGFVSLIVLFGIDHLISIALSKDISVLLTFSTIIISWWLILPAAQGFVLREKNISAKKWFFMNAFISLLITIMLISILALTLDQVNPDLAGIDMVAITGFFSSVGLAFGISQWIILNKVVRKAGVLIPSSLICWLSVLLIFYFFSILQLNIHLITFLGLIIYTILFIIAGGVFGLLSGLILITLLPKYPKEA